MKWETEEGLAAAVVAWLQDLKWTVYQEVQVRYGDPIADIVAVQGQLVWIVECKTALSLTVMAQASRWRHCSHYISVAVSRCRKSKERSFAEGILRDRGIGLIEADEFSIIEMLPPALSRSPWTKRFRESLNERHLTYAAAGNARGHRWSPFQETCDQVRREVLKTPGLTLKELMGRITHHYSSSATARSCIAKWAREGVIRGVRYEKQDKLIRLYPEGSVSDEVQGLCFWSSYGGERETVLCNTPGVRIRGG